MILKRFENIIFIPLIVRNIFPLFSIFKRKTFAKSHEEDYAFLCYITLCVCVCTTSVVLFTKQRESTER